MKGMFFGAAVSVLTGMTALIAQPVITEEPQSRTAAEGRPVNFSVQAQGSGRLEYQWQFNGDDIPGARGRTLSFYATPSRVGTYSVVVRDTTGAARRSSPAELQVQKRPVILSHPRNQNVGQHQNAAFEVRVNDSAPYRVVQWWHHSSAEPSHPIPPSAARGVNTFKLEVLDATDNGTFNGLYWIVITNDVGWTMSRRAKLNVVGPPELFAQPRDLSVRRGGNASFSVRIAPDDAGPKTKQWFRNGQPIPGATGRVLIIRNAQPENDGYYQCRVTSVGGTTSSYAARLTVF